MRWVVVVRPDRPDLYPTLHKSFSQTPWVRVLVDRRRPERPSEVPLDPSGRPVDRRRVPGDASRTEGYRLAHGADGFQVFEAEEPIRAPCPECGRELEFSIPRFVEPPARLELTVVHETTKVQGASRQHRHIVELQAFTATGRALLASRIAARPRLEHDPRPEA